jgi:hypothetical protein
MASLEDVDVVLSTEGEQAGQVADRVKAALVGRFPRSGA